MRKPLKCPMCGARMHRTGFDENERGETMFHYACDRCGATMKKPLTRQPTQSDLRVGSDFDIRPERDGDVQVS